MNQVPDRKRLRREYLRKKASAYSDVAIYSVLYLPALCLVIGSGVFVIVNVWFKDWPSVAGMTLTTFLFGCLAWYCRRRITESTVAVTKVPYAPPVTPDTLPADEILVRGSTERPVEQSEVLLRAARGQETPKEELLRATAENK